MSDSLWRRVLETIHRRRMIRPGDVVGVGVSGGADSVALFRLLHERQTELGIRILVLHFHHQLRGEEADEDQKFVEELAGQFQSECLSAGQDVAALAREQRLNLEDAARRARYAFFTRVVSEGRATRIAVAHTLDDQAETLLGHLIRGTGPAGLASIYPEAGVVVRPLLDVRRAELRAYLTSLGQPWREDRTNADTSRLRARIRLTLLPQLEQNFEPHVVEHLGRLAALAREDESFWAALVEDRYRALVTASAAGAAIRAADLLAPLAWKASPGAERALTKRLVRRIVAGLRARVAEEIFAPAQLTARHVEQVLELASQRASGRRIDLPGGLTAERSFDMVRFGAQPSKVQSAETRVPASPFQYEVAAGAPGDASVAVPEIKRRFYLKFIDWPQRASDTRIQGPTLDGELLRPPLVIRNWRPGDTYQPQGRRHAHKLIRLLQEQRVTLCERRTWPVLTSAGKLVWARGLPVAAEYAPGRKTRSGVVILEEEL